MGQSIPDSESLASNFHSIGIGGSGGAFTNEIRYNPHIGDCGGTVYDSKFYKEQHGFWGANYQYATKEGFTSSSLGVDLFVGNVSETDIGTGHTEKYTNWGLRPYGQFNTRWVGLGGGIVFGSLYYVPDNNTVEKYTVTSGLKSTPLLPSAHIRVGPYDIFDIEYRAFNDFPSALPMLTHQLSMGSGLGFDNGSGIRLGISTFTETYFISGSALISNKVMLQTKYVWGDASYFSLGLHYRIHTKTE